ncbi:MAG: PIN domain-containing protein [Cystobacterineae bacterium]|nr:PIN domain-containing protein [Cystobacterineae bacterium]
MKCMLDTNVLVSAALFPEGTCAAAYVRAVMPPCKSVVCDYVLDELTRVFQRKFPHQLEALERFVSQLALSVEIVPTPPEAERAENESVLSDAADRPILRAALAAGVDLLITGDKGFLEAALDKPLCLSAAAFLQRVG